MSRTKSILVAGTAVAAVLAYACSNDPEQSSSSSSSSGTGSSSSGGASSSSGGLVDSGGLDATGATDAGSDAAGWVGPDGGISAAMNFFVTSKGNGKGGDFRAAAGDADGLAGADAFCKGLAQAVSPVLGAKTWRAYLSTNAVTARSRIGTGPFYNAKGVMIAATVAQLHDEGGANNLLSLANTLDELGGQVPATGTVLHDILTGTTAAGASAPTNCANWTSSATNVTAMVGHSNRGGGGAAPTSWNAAHATAGCANAGNNSVASGGGRGSIYCFAL